MSLSSFVLSALYYRVARPPVLSVATTTPVIFICTRKIEKDTLDASFVVCLIFNDCPSPPLSKVKTTVYHKMADDDFDLYGEDESFKPNIDLQVSAMLSLTPSFRVERVSLFALVDRP